MKVKVCGMRDPENISELTQLDIDYIGYIFYSKSPRNVVRNPNVEIPSAIQKVGVFVNESVEFIQERVIEYQLDFAQLHGDETPEFCKELKEKGLKIIKAFSIGDGFDFKQLDRYASCCELFLFDAKGENYGGNGTTFNWALLKHYDGVIPFLLSGGISSEYLDEIVEIQHPQLLGIDVNSGFEVSPAMKDVKKVKKMVEKIKNHG
ncbi:MAG: phosphoribosylanthranilate isomerase [Flavobacteriales bacterium]|nr:phosphoribosylanthranilate isomerase [Flavobacteriales bacterium]